jgi:hypothetical protein
MTDPCDFHVIQIQSKFGANERAGCHDCRTKYRTEPDAKPVRKNLPIFAAWTCTAPSLHFNSDYVKYRKGIRIIDEEKIEFFQPFVCR